MSKRDRIWALERMLEYPSISLSDRPFEHWVKLLAGNEYTERRNREILSGTEADKKLAALLDYLGLEVVKTDYVVRKKSLELERDEKGKFRKASNG